LGTARFGDSAQGLYQSEVHVDIRALEALAVRTEVAGRDGILAPVAADSLPDQPPAGSRSAPNFTLTTTWSRGRPLSVSPISILLCLWLLKTPNALKRLEF
jgi:hypothetical protein